jgi:acetyl-CoA carboxylase beta subunit
MILMECRSCGVMVQNPKTLNYMAERCTPCEMKFRELANRAIDTYLDEKAEAELNAQSKTDSPAR